MNRSSELPVHTCTCGHRLEAAEAVLEREVKPHSGDVSLCINCGRAWVFNEDLTLREPTYDEQWWIAKDTLVRRAQTIIEKRGPIPRKTND